MTILIQFKVTDKQVHLIDQVDAFVDRHGDTSRSQFIRQAIADKLAREKAKKQESTTYDIN
jgi:metal-responsive CopG/Arc/MetJ family transcriptional regulator